jgi:precorrin-2 dehydrogenase
MPDAVLRYHLRVHPLFPLFVKLEARHCVVIGAGSVGEGKIESLLRCGAEITVIAPEATPRVRDWAAVSQLVWHHRAFTPRDLEGAFLVVAATSSPEINHAIATEARRRGVLCNVVDDPDYCDFYYPAVVHRGPLQIAISTSGIAPALASRIRKELDAQFGPEYEAWLAELEAKRKQIITTISDPSERRSQIEALTSEEALQTFRKSRKHSND